MISSWHPLLKYLAALGGTLGAYLVYVAAVVPWVEGGKVEYGKSAALLAQADENAVPTPASESLAWLPSDAWERGTCKRIEIDEGVVLFRDWSQRDDGIVEVFPFTLVLASGKTGSAGAPSDGRSTGARNPIIVRADDRAELKFDRPLTFGSGNQGKLQSCQLKGNVHLFRPARNQQDSEAFSVWTSNVQMTPSRVVSLEKVQFEFGAHSGIGRNLLIDLSHDSPGSAIRPHFESIDGIQRLELAFIERVRLVPEQATTRPSQADDADLSRAEAIPNASGEPGQPAGAPIDVTCAGPFIFDFAAQRAEFQKEVVVTRLDEYGDQITGDRLQLIFGSDVASRRLAGQRNEGHRWSELRLERIELLGTPARLNLPSQSAEVSGSTLVYDLTRREVRGQDPQRVEIRHGDYQFSSSRIQYRIREDGGLGPLIAEGPGQLNKVASVPDADDQMVLDWQDHLTIDAIDGRQRIHVEGQVVASLPQRTRLAGEMLDLWLHEEQVVVASQAPGLEQPKAKWTYEPLELVIDRNVRVTTKDLVGSTRFMKLIWPDANGVGRSRRVGTVAPAPFREDLQVVLKTRAAVHPAEPARAARVMRVPFEPQEPANALPQNVNRREPDPELEPLPPLPRPRSGVPADMRPSARTDPAVRLPSPASGDRAGDPSGVAAKLQVTGDTITIQMPPQRPTALADEAPFGDPNREAHYDFERLDIDGNVLVRQPDQESGQDRFAISGDTLVLIPQSRDRFQAQVSGQARIESAQLTLSGNQIHLDQSANRVWSVGPGELELTTRSASLPAPSPAASGPVESPQRVQVAWTAGMIFDGEKVYFEQDVRSATTQEGKDFTTTKLRSVSEGMSLELSRRLALTLDSDARRDGADISVSQIILVNSMLNSERAFPVQKRDSDSADNQSRPVVLEKSTLDARGQMLNKQLVIVPHVVMNVVTGDLRADGPGGLISWQAGQADESRSPFSLVGSRGESEAVKPNPRSSPSASGLTYVHVNFDKRLVGNTENERVRINGNVRTLYAQVANWDQQLDPDSASVPKGGTRITCDQIDVARWQPQGSEQPATEVIASGNTRIIGDLYEATASRLAFDERSQILTIEGDERNAANLWSQQDRASARNHLAAGKIRYRPSDGWTSIDNVKRASVSNLPGRPGK